MFKKISYAIVFACTAAIAQAETFEVKMLNKGEAGAMVFEPAYVKAMPGDVIHFIATDKGHNVESIKGMLPEGSESFKSKFNVDYELTVDAEGLYGIKCTPHYGMGMVALIQVGDAVNLEAAQGVKQRGKSKGRFEDLFARVQ
ncbi:pseudoazurin [Tritonibacter scottomollicae]|uniref:Pseudoazurin n=1 Tax=Tritonibacter scottomollicae TaxID=483013 RepID=A0A2T1AE69_TRISK|nr:pseudoazurin [Tritonibacter scottomollicae]PRZ46871.1 pseudoazurin [Tritonibacter scottomollicae]WOI35298.1 pseudoazurin [Tritonibacter scottomollicae]